MEKNDVTDGINDYSDIPVFAQKEPKNGANVEKSDEKKIQEIFSIEDKSLNFDSEAYKKIIDQKVNEIMGDKRNVLLKEELFGTSAK